MTPYGPGIASVPGFRHFAPKLSSFGLPWPGRSSEPAESPRPQARQTRFTARTPEEIAELIRPQTAVLRWNPNLAPHEAAPLAVRSVYPAAQRVSSEPHKDKGRSRVSELAIQASFFGGGAKAVLDSARLLAKAPDSVRGGRTKPWVSSFLKNAVDTRIVDPAWESHGAASAANGWKAFTKFDSATYRTSAVMSLGISSVQFASAIPNLTEALSKDGPAGLYNSKSGRSGVLQFAGGGFGLGVLGAALVGARRAGARGLVETMVKASASPRLANPLLVNVAVASGAVTLMNEWGFFDFLDHSDAKHGVSLARPWDVTSKLVPKQDQNALLNSGGGYAAYLTKGTGHSLVDTFGTSLGNVPLL